MDVDKELRLPGYVGAVAFIQHHVAVQLFLKLPPCLFNLSKRLIPRKRREAVVYGGRNEREKGDSLSEPGKGALGDSYTSAFRC